MEEKYPHLNAIQKVGLNILKEFVKICNCHNLKYYIYGGTLLGAIRHKGYIPWDDDIDIAMPRKDFELFKQFVNELPEYLYFDPIERKGHMWGSAHVMDKRTKVRAGKALKRQEMNVWIDILPIDGVPRPGSLTFKLYSIAYLFARLLYKFSHFDGEVDLTVERPWYERLLIEFAKVSHIQSLINQPLAAKFMEWVSKWYDIDKCDYWATLAGPKKMDETQPKYWFGEGRYFQFEDITVLGMSEAEKFCIKFYGEDYMTPPPMDKRNRHDVELIM